MLYRIALALGLFVLGTHLGREVARTKPTRVRAKQTRLTRSERLAVATLGKIGKVSLH